MMMNFDYLPFGGLGWILMVVWWVLIIAGIAALIKWLLNNQSGERRDGGSTRRDGKTAIDILKERYAKGEIDKEEFDRRKKDLL